MRCCLPVRGSVLRIQYSASGAGFQFFLRVLRKILDAAVGRRARGKKRTFSRFCVDIIIVEKSVESVNNPDFMGKIPVDSALFFGGRGNFLPPLRVFFTIGGGARKTLAIVGKKHYNTQGIVSLAAETERQNGRKIDEKLRK